MPHIRPYNNDTPQDLDAITAIYAHHVLHGSASFEVEPPSRDEMRARLDLLVENGFPVLVCRRDQTDSALGDPAIIGYAYAGPHKARAGYSGTVEDSVYVHPNAVREGVGSALLGRLVEITTERGFHQMMAVIGDSENEASIALHRAHGFTHIGTARRIGFKFGRNLDVVYMQRQLAERSDDTAP